MSTLVSLVLSNADKLPIVGSPIGQATMWYFSKRNSTGGDDTLCETPPPPYENLQHSRLTQLSDYVWKRASFSSASVVQQDDEAIMTLDTAGLDKKQAEEGITLIQMATQMSQDTKHHQMSLDLYLLGLDKILACLPVDADPAVKESLEKKLASFKQKHHLDLTDHTSKKPLTEKQQQEALGGLSNLVIHAAVTGAIALKKSALPGIVSRVFQVTKDSFAKLDEACSIRERTLNITSAGLSKAIELDQHYEVHQFFAEIFYTGCTAILKASIAYAEEEDSVVTPTTAES